jgi:hypothetical protein
MDFAVGVNLSEAPPRFFVWSGLTVLEVLNLARYRVLNSCRIWSPTAYRSKYPPPHTLSVYTVL